MEQVVTVTDWIKELEKVKECAVCGSSNVAPLIFPNDLDLKSPGLKEMVGKTGIGIVCGDCFASAFLSQEELGGDEQNE